MPPGGLNSAATAALQIQIDGLGERMDKGFEELKAILRSYEERTRAIEQREAGCQPIITSRMDAAWRKLDEHETKFETVHKDVDELDKKLVSVMFMYRVFVFISSALGLSIISLIWALITGRAEITFK